MGVIPDPDGRPQPTWPDAPGPIDPAGWEAGVIGPSEVGTMGRFHPAAIVAVDEEVQAD